MNNNPFVQPPEAAETRPFCMGVITSVTGGLYAQIENVERAISIKRLASYTPAVGDRVIIGRITGTCVVLGKVV